MSKLATGSLEKGLFRDDVTMFTWLLQNLSENDRTLFGSFQKVRSNPAEFLKTQFKSLDCSIMGVGGRYCVWRA